MNFNIEFSSVASQTLGYFLPDFYEENSCYSCVYVQTKKRQR